MADVTVGLVLHGAEEFGWHGPADLVHDWAAGVAHAVAVATPALAAINSRCGRSRYVSAVAAPRSTTLAGSAKALYDGG